MELRKKQSFKQTLERLMTMPNIDKALFVLSFIYSTDSPACTQYIWRHVNENFIFILGDPKIRELVIEGWM